jgi:hypothetical protein
MTPYIVTDDQSIFLCNVNLYTTYMGYEINIIPYDTLYQIALIQKQVNVYFCSGKYTQEYLNGKCNTGKI